MKVLVCGGRNFRDRNLVWTALDRLYKQTSGSERFVVIQGGAQGADRLAYEWCADRYVWCENYPADWRKHGKAAGPIRNQQMIDEGRPDLVVAFEGGIGTANMIALAARAGLEVVRPEWVTYLTAKPDPSPPPSRGREARNG